MNQTVNSLNGHSYGHLLTNSLSCSHSSTSGGALVDSDGAASDLSASRGANWLQDAT